MSEFDDIGRLIDIHRNTVSLKNQTSRAFSSMVRAKGNMTDEFQEVSDELKRVSEEFSHSIELMEKMIRSHCKEVV